MSFTIVLSVLWKGITPLLDLLITILFCCVHRSMILMAVLICEMSPMTTISSANSLTNKSFDLSILMRDSIKMLNRIGDVVPPCGTPFVGLIECFPMKLLELVNRNLRTSSC
jgi:hypothetical protein